MQNITQFQHWAIRIRSTRMHYTYTRNTAHTRPRIVQIIETQHRAQVCTLHHTDTANDTSSNMDPYNMLKPRSSSVDSGRRIPGWPVHPHLGSLLACQLPLKRLDLVAQVCDDTHLVVAGSKKIL